MTRLPLFVLPGVLLVALGARPRVRAGIRAPGACGLRRRPCRARTRHRVGRRRAQPAARHRRSPAHRARACRSAVRRRLHSATRRGDHDRRAVGFARPPACRPGRDRRGQRTRGTPAGRHARGLGAHHECGRVQDQRVRRRMASPRSRWPSSVEARISSPTAAPSPSAPARARSRARVRPRRSRCHSIRHGGMPSIAGRRIGCRSAAARPLTSTFRHPSVRTAPCSTPTAAGTTSPPTATSGIRTWSAAGVRTTTAAGDSTPASDGRGWAATSGRGRRTITAGGARPPLVPGSGCRAARGVRPGCTGRWRRGTSAGARSGSTAGRWCHSDTRTRRARVVQAGSVDSMDRRAPRSLRRVRVGQARSGGRPPLHARMACTRSSFRPRRRDDRTRCPGPPAAPGTRGGAAALAGSRSRGAVWGCLQAPANAPGKRQQPAMRPRRPSPAASRPKRPTAVRRGTPDAAVQRKPAVRHSRAAVPRCALRANPAQGGHYGSAVPRRAPARSTPHRPGALRPRVAQGQSGTRTRYRSTAVARSPRGLMIPGCRPAHTRAPQVRRAVPVFRALRLQVLCHPAPHARCPATRHRRTAPRQTIRGPQASAAADLSAAGVRSTCATGGERERGRYREAPGPAGTPRDGRAPRGSGSRRLSCGRTSWRRPAPRWRRTATVEGPVSGCATLATPLNSIVVRFLSSPSGPFRHPLCPPRRYRRVVRPRRDRRYRLRPVVRVQRRPAADHRARRLRTQHDHAPQVARWRHHRRVRHPAADRHRLRRHSGVAAARHRGRGGCGVRQPFRT